MVNIKQGSIIKIDFNPQKGHEQKGYRPAIVISNDFFNTHSNMTIVCPITNTHKKYPLHVDLDKRTTTTGCILCEHVKAVDLSSRKYQFIEMIPHDLLEKVIDITFSEIEIL